uniref:Uncharacterized protein n=1 Tax=Spironucleus salmonicida TaxID=348837 RepID=V6LF22_9EUKA|eukprot:EST43135.1 Hypothetical protein SS50377_17220 [Spironucleus salmonicida]
MGYEWRLSTILRIAVNTIVLTLNLQYVKLDTHTSLVSATKIYVACQGANQILLLDSIVTLVRDIATYAYYIMVNKYVIVEMQNIA